LWRLCIDRIRHSLALIVTVDLLSTTAQRALAMMAAMMGGVAASRAVAKANPELSDEILLAVREVMSQVGGENLQVRAKARGAENKAALKRRNGDDRAATCLDCRVGR
jgi:hypothetical protein